MKVYLKYNKIILLLIIALVLALMTLTIKFYFKPFISILILMLFIRPIYNCLQKINIPSKIAGALGILIINVILFCFIFYFGNEMARIINKALKNGTNDFIILERNIKLIFGFEIDKVLQSGLKSFSGNMLKSGASITGEGILSYIIGNICVYFLITDKERFSILLGKIIPQEILQKAFIKKENLKNVIRIELRLVIICTVIIIAGFKILGIPSSLLLGILCGILDILPYVGTIIVFIPIIIYNIIMEKYLVVIGLIALYLLSQIIREILELKYLSSKLDIHPLAIMLSIYIGAEMFGFIGILAGPIYCLLAKDIIYS